jgi:hypothetical protein
MLAKTVIRILLTALWVMSPVVVQAQDSADAPVGVIELRERANRAYTTKDHETFRDALVQLHAMRPNNSEYMYQLVLAHALLDEKSAAYDLMMKMQKQGLSYDFDQAEDAAGLRGTEVYDYLNELMKNAGQAFGAVAEVATLDPAVTYPAGIDWDPGRQAFLVGTVAEGLILETRPDGSTRELLRADQDNGLWGIFDLLVDASRNRLWVSSAATRQFSGFDPVDTGRSAVFELTLDSLELVKRYPVPVDGMPHRLGKLVLGPDGSVYAADGRLPIIYAKPADKDRMQPVFASSQLLSLRGMTMSDDGRMLYVADYEMGIVFINTGTGAYGMLRIPPTLNLGGIEGLNYWDGHLVIIQSGISPQRVMRLQLGDEGVSVVRLAPMAVALEDFDVPTYGTVVDDQLYFFANSHWGVAGEGLKPVKIVRTDLAGGQNIIEPDLEALRQQLLQERDASGVSDGAAEDSGPEG